MPAPMQSKVIILPEHDMFVPWVDQVHDGQSSQLYEPSLMSNALGWAVALEQLSRCASNFSENT